MRIVVVGSGAREHALCVALSEGNELICAPGNAGTALVAESRPLDLSDNAAIARLARESSAELVVIGPEVPLVAGAADAVRAAGIPCFGPTAAAARIEGSKDFAKQVMAAAGVPTAAARTCTDAAEAEKALDEFGPPFVVKDDGLAAGKGVVVTSDRAAALAHAASCERVVIEEYLDGPEISLLYLVDGTTFRPMIPAQDFKRAGDGDSGPNTGGMGAYAPLPWAPRSLVTDVSGRVVAPTLAELDRRGTPFSGLLYVGLALTAAGPKVVEFNARFGDPETQVVLPLLQTPLAEVLYAVAVGRLAEFPELSWKDESAVTVVMAAAGYPESPRSGDVISGADGPGVLHAGTRRRDDGALVSSGGRVLSVTATGPTLAAARDSAYERVGAISFAGAHFRTDIAGKASQ